MTSTAARRLGPCCLLALAGAVAPLASAAATPDGPALDVVIAIDTTTNQVKVQTPAGQRIVLAMPPAALRSIQIGDPFTFTVPAPPR